MAKNIFYNLEQDWRVNSDNSRNNSKFKVRYQENPDLVFNFLADDGTAFDLTEIVSAEFAIANDFKADGVMTRTTFENIDLTDKADGIIKVPVNTVYAEFLSVVTGKRYTQAFMRLKLIDGNGKAKYSAVLEIDAEMDIDPPEGAALELPDNYPTFSEVMGFVRDGREFQFSVDGITDWHSTQAEADRYYQERYPEGEWSVAIEMVQGPQGIQGIQGEQGLQGIQGIQGVQGVQGVKGDTGTSVIVKGSVATVETLPDSEQTVGDLYVVLADGHGYAWNGTSWEDCGLMRGPQGEQGIQGQQGIQGVQGVKGDTGAQGIQGVQGPAGEQGIQGIQGVQGAKGDKGEKGDEGTSVVLKGSVPTVDDLPDTGNTVGDLYVVLADGHGYVWNGTSWDDVGPIRGPAGEQGIQGEQGLQGIQGIQGATGATGATGAQGIQGVKGDTGAQGAQGTQGIQGEVGPQGIQGETGLQGLKGDKGDTGNTGATGATGAQGPKGDTGNTGAAGADGVDAFVYVAWASDNTGTGWSLTPSESLPYRAEIHSATALTPIASDFVSATWVQCLGTVGGGTTIETLLFRVPNMADDSALHFALETFETADYTGTATESFNTATAQTNVKVFDGSAWIAFPSEGVGDPYYENKLAVDLQSVESGTQYYLRYKWFIKGSDPDDTPWEYSQYPALETNTALKNVNNTPIADIPNPFDVDHNIIASDAGTTIYSTGTGDVILSLVFMEQSSGDFITVNSIIGLVKENDGVLVLEGSGGVVINGIENGSFEITEKYTSALLIHRAPNVYTILGNAVAGA